LKFKKTLVVVVTGLIGLILIFSILEISVMREIPKQLSDAATDGLPAASANSQQIEFAERFAIQTTNSTSFEAVQARAPGATWPSEVYLRAYDSVSEARTSIGRYLDFYDRRPHSSLDGATPDQAYFSDLPIRMAA
jgi:hypothetical protein